MYRCIKILIDWIQSILNDNFAISISVWMNADIYTEYHREVKIEFFLNTFFEILTFSLRLGAFRKSVKILCSTLGSTPNVM